MHSTVYISFLYIFLFLLQLSFIKSCHALCWSRLSDTSCLAPSAPSDTHVLDTSSSVQSDSSDATIILERNRVKRSHTDQESAKVVYSYLHFCNEWNYLILRDKDIMQTSCGFVAGKVNTMANFLILLYPSDGERCSPVKAGWRKNLTRIWQNEDIDGWYTETDGKPTGGWHGWSSLVSIQCFHCC